MKKVLLPVLAILALTIMSFSAKDESKIEIVKTDNGEFLTNIELLSFDDLKTLNDATLRGSDAVLYIERTYIHHYLDYAIIKHTDPAEPEEEISKLDEILAKYK